MKVSRWVFAAALVAVSLCDLDASPNPKFLDLFDIKGIPNGKNPSEFFGKIESVWQFRYPGFRTISGPILEGAPLVRMVDPEILKKKAQRATSEFHLNTCNCPYHEPYLQALDVLADLKSKAVDPDTFLVSALRYFVVRTVHDLFVHRHEFSLDGLVLEHGQIQTNCQRPSQGKDDWKLPLFFQMAFATHGGSQMVGKNVGVFVNFDGKSEKEGDKLVFRIIARMKVVSSFRFHDFCNNLDTLNKYPSMSAVVVEELAAEHNLLPNLCVTARAIVDQMIHQILLPVRPAFRAVNFCSETDHIALLFEGRKQDKEELLFRLQGNIESERFDILNKLNRDQIGHSELQSQQMIFQEDLDASESDNLKKQTDPVFDRHRFFFQLLRLPGNPLESGPPKFVTASDPAGRPIHSFQLANDGKRNFAGLSPLQWMSEMLNSDRASRLDIVTTRSTNLDTILSQKETENIDAVLKTEGWNFGQLHCGNLEFLLSLPWCPFLNDQVCRDLAYLRTVNGLLFACDITSALAPEGAKAIMRLWVSSGNFRLAVFTFSVHELSTASLALNPGPESKNPKYLVCYESEAKLSTILDSKIHCWKDVEKLDLQKSPKYFTAFLGHFAERVRVIDERLRSRLSRFEVMEFLLMVKNDYERTRDRPDSAKVDPKDLLVKMMENHNISDDLEFQVSGETVSLQTRFRNRPDLLFTLEVYDKSPDYIVAVLQTPAKRETIYVSKDTGTGSGFGVLSPLRSGQASKTEKFGQLLADHALQLYDFFNSIWPPFLPTRSYPYCFPYLAKAIDSENVGFGAFMGLVQFALAKQGWVRVLKQFSKPSSIASQIVGIPTCENDRKFGMLHEKTHDILSSLLQNDELQSVETEMDTEPLQKWLFYKDQADLVADADYLNFQADLTPEATFPDDPQISLTDVLGFSLESEFGPGTSVVTMLFGNRQIRRMMSVKAYIYDQGLFRSVHLVLSTGYFDQESIVALSSLRDHHTHVPDLIAGLTKKVETMATKSRSTGKKQGYTLKVVQGILEGLFVEEALKLNACRKAEDGEGVWGVKALIAKSATPVDQPTGQVVQSDRLLFLPIFVKNSLTERRLEGIQNCGPTDPLIGSVVLTSNPARQELTVAVSRSEKSATQVPSVDAYTFRKSYPFDHIEMLKEHLREMLAKLKD